MGPTSTTQRGRSRLAAGRRLVARADRVLSSVPVLRRSLAELVRVEFVDRATVVAAQALLALLPLLVVMIAFLPDDLTGLTIDRLQDVTGLRDAREVVGDAGVVPADETTQAQMGVVGIVLTLLSASSFARALMRAYEVVWDLPHVGGLRGRRRCLGWLLLWLAGLQGVAGVGWARGALDDVPGAVVADVVLTGVQVALACLLWWWTLHVLLAGRVAWRALVLPGVLTGVAVLVYAAGSSVVMPLYVTSSATQLGGFGLLLALAAWLVGLAGVLVVVAVVGRVVSEDPWCRRRWDRLRRG